MKSLVKRKLSTLVCTCAIMGTSYHYFSLALFAHGHFGIAALALPPPRVRWIPEERTNVLIIAYTNDILSREATIHAWHVVCYERAYENMRVASHMRLHVHMIIRVIC